MIDFTDSPIKNKTYAGANGNKISIVYRDELYMLKFPSSAIHNSNISYANGCVSEYLGCHIFESIGLKAQETLLGYYNVKGKQKLVVACKDFTVGGFVLQDFASLKNTVIDSETNGYGTELSDIEETMLEQKVLDSKTLIDWFWDMFIVDALIGNWDRHNGNWGFLYQPETDQIKLAPIFDCGSCLFPQVDPEMMKLILENQNELDVRIYQRPLSGIKINGKKINYFSFISSLENENCNLALARITPKIDLVKINKIIDSTSGITELQKRFYKTIIKQRKERILDFSLSKLNKIKSMKG